MSTDDTLLEFAQGLLRDANQTGIPTKVLALVEYVDPSGEHTLLISTLDGMSAWDVVGMLAFEQAALLNRVEPDQEWEP